MRLVTLNKKCCGLNEPNNQNFMIDIFLRFLRVTKNLKTFDKSKCRKTKKGQKKIVFAKFSKFSRKSMNFMKNKFFFEIQKKKCLNYNSRMQF